MSRGRIHAVEVNGLRPWRENQAAIDLACAWECRIVSGGNRHGYEPNAVLNLTRRTTFSAFVVELRDGVSDTLVMNHYREPLELRTLLLAHDVMKGAGDWPDHAGWRDRVLVRLTSGDWTPVSGALNGHEPVVIRWIERAMRLAAAPGVRHLLRLWFSADSGSMFA